MEKINLNKKFNFNTFIESEDFKNSLIIKKLSTLSSFEDSIFIYGKKSTGKTHLLQAIGHQHQKNGKNVIYITGEYFMNNFSKHLRYKTIDKFKHHFRDCDVLLIDDINQLRYKSETQNELYYTINELKKDNKLVICSSNNKITASTFKKRDTDVKYINFIEYNENISNHFYEFTQIGLEIATSTQQLKITEKIIEEYNLSLKEDGIEFLIENSKNNIKQLIGSIKTLSFYEKPINASSQKIEISLNSIKKRLG